MESSSDSDFSLTIPVKQASRRDSGGTDQKNINYVEEPDTSDTKRLQTSPHHQIQGLDSPECSEKENYIQSANNCSTQHIIEESSSRISRRAATRAKNRLSETPATNNVQVNISNEDIRNNNFSKLIEENNSNDEESDDSFTVNDGVESSISEDGGVSDDSSFEDIKSKSKRGKRNSLSGSKKASPVTVTKKAKSNGKKTLNSTAIKKDVVKPTNISSKGVRGGLHVATSSVKLPQSNNSSRLLHVRPIRAGLSKKSPIQRLHTNLSS